MLRRGEKCLMKKICLIILVLSLVLCSCSSETEERSDEKIVTTEETLEETEIALEEDVFEALETPEGEPEQSQEDIGYYNVSREDLIAQALQEEESRRIMPEIYEAEDIIAYIARTGGKAYQGTYNGGTYYMYLTADCSYSSGSYYYFIPYVTVVREKDTSVNPNEFGGRQNFYGIILDETEQFLDINSKYKFGYKGTDYEVGHFGNIIESDSSNGFSGLELEFISSTNVVYTFLEDWPDKGQIQFTAMEPDEAKYWYSQNALNGNFNDFLYFEGSPRDNSYVRVEFTDGFNMQTLDDDYYMTVVSTDENLDTYDKGEYHILVENYSYSDFSKLEDDEFMLEFISDRQAVLTNKLTGTSALVKYMMGYLTDKEGINGSQFYFLDNRINETIFISEDGISYIDFYPSLMSSWVDAEDKTDVGERVADIAFQGEFPVSFYLQIIDGNTLRIREICSNTDLLLVWEDDEHFMINGTGDYLEGIDGMRFEYDSSY